MNKVIATGMMLSMATVMTTEVALADKVENVVYGIVKVDSNDVLNLRASGNANAKILAEMEPNARIEVLDSSNTWYKVKYKGITGYASGRYINIESKEVSSSSIKGVASSNGSNLNVRSKADINSSIVGKLKNGTSVNIEGQAVNGWYPINYQGKVRYVSSKYIKVSNSNINSTPSANQGESVIGKIATVSANTLNVRAGAGTNYSVINKVYLGNDVKILSENTNGWYKVSLTSGSTGWCSDDYLKNIRTGDLVISNNSINTNNNIVVSQSEKAKKVINMAKTKLGCPYVWGAEGPNSFDCSGFTFYIYKNSVGVKLPRTSKSQSTYGKYVSKENLQPGDLVFFDSSYGSNINHVGIYIGNNEMIHSPRSGDVVKVQKIDTNYYKKAYVTARRVL